MSVHVVPNSAKISILAQPKITNRISISIPDNAFIGVTDSDKIKIQGDLQLDGNKGESAKGWRIGFIQVLLVETCYAYYRGQSNTDGSIFIQLAQPPAYIRGVCRDTLDNANTIFYKLTPDYDSVNNVYEPPPLIKSPTGNFPIPVQTYISDNPFIFWNLEELNNQTKKKNYLQEAGFNYRFCTVLSAQDPKGIFHHQAHFYWQVAAQATFTPLVYSPKVSNWLVTNGINTVNVGAVNKNDPTDARFALALTSPKITRSCNELSGIALNRVSKPTSQNRHESTVWSTFDIIKP